jgi:hypothetical protein
VTTTAPGSDVLVTLVDEQRQLTERLDALNTVVEELGAAHTELAKEVHARAARRRAPWWPFLTPEERAARWGQLVDWLRHTLLPRQPGFGVALEPGHAGSDAKACWYRHPDVVDDLTALYGLWRAAYVEPSASAALAAEWLERWVPATRRRVTEALKGCTRNHYLEPGELPGDEATMLRWVGGIDPATQQGDQQ